MNNTQKHGFINGFDVDIVNLVKKQYVQRMKLRDPELNKGWVQIVHILEIETLGVKQKINCANSD